MEPKAKSMNDMLGMIKRRKWSLILPMLIVFTFAGIVALVLPPTYKSTATILIEEQDIPADFVMATVTSFAEQRLQSIYQRIISYSKLLDIINRFNLYPDTKGRSTDEKIVEKMREDILLEPISVDVTDRRTGRPSIATIAFTLSYQGKSPDTVQQVANVITSAFLEENLQVRERHAAETSDFLEKEMERVKTELSELEARMAVFKAAHVNELPELLQVNMQSLNNAKSSIQSLNQQLRSLKEREGYLQSQLASIPLEIKDEEDKVRLAQLRVELVNLRTRFSDQYPDVIRARAEIAELEKRVGQTGNPGSSSNLPDNPVYINLAAQLSSTQAEIDSVQRQIREAYQASEMYQRRIARTPKVEEEYKAILVERDNTHAKYNDLMQKHMEARVAQGLEKDQKGERFTLIEPARLPETPDKPNRLAIALLGVVLGIGAGVGWMSFREFTDHSIHNADTLTLETSFPVLGSIPIIQTAEDLARKKRKRLMIIIALILCVVGGLVALHFWVMDLNVFWSRLMRKVG